MTGCPRIDVHTTAVQLLQVLDKRFFGNVGPLQTECEKGKFSVPSTPNMIFTILNIVHINNKCDEMPIPMLQR